MNTSNNKVPSFIPLSSPTSSTSTSTVCFQEHSIVRDDHHRHNPPIFQPMGSNSDKFISSASIIMLCVFFLLLRSSAGPFLNPHGGAKKGGFFFYFTCFLYTWVLSVTTITLIPSFSTHYNGVIAASLFFPMCFSSIGAMLIGRFIIRVAFYFSSRFGLFVFGKAPKPNRISKDNKDTNSNVNTSKKMMVPPMNRSNQNKLPAMVAFHRPFRTLTKNASIIAFTLSILYAHCWSRTLSVFKVSVDDGAGAVCRAVFTPFVGENDDGAKENSIWYLWAGAIFIMIISFAQDEYTGLHHRNNEKNSAEVESLDGDYDTVSIGKDDESSLEDSNDEDSVFGKPGMNPISTFLSNTTKERPKDTLEMVPWLSLFALSSVIDIFLQLMVFSGRVDARSMQSALQRNVTRKETHRNNKTKQTDEEKFRSLRDRYPGSIFDYSSELKKDTDGGFWFDFLADCGDGFNSSYQVARILAQPNITATYNDGKQRRLPRGQFLLNGGDLAYPNPSEYSYEKRFFRAFEDALPPPHSFRRTKIATNKPDLPVKGWKNCFYDVPKDSQTDIHEIYKGPSSFVLPGNHDWYDGLATYSRLILCRDWLGGWLMPQQRSYFSLKLQHGWWVFGMDCGLSDIDIEQYKFFADIADNIGPNDAVIIVNHMPDWVIDFDLGMQESHQNIRELMETHLKGKVRLRIAGDLHHYTRHIPVRKSSPIKHKRRRSRSFSFDEKMKAEDGDNPKYDRLEPFTEENRPELIVSGGGGAFLHGTHYFSNNIKVGNLNYKRVCAFPNEKVSFLISSLNLWHFRWRNYRADWLMALVYFGIVSSLFPLCGIYADYETFNPQHDVKLLISWSFRKLGSLIWRVMTSENVSLFWSCVVLSGALGLQASDNKMHPILRFVCALLHGLAHIAAALSCLLFVQSVTEWIVQDDIVKISINNEHFNGTHLASSLYENYKTHFFPTLKNYTHPESSILAQYYLDKQVEESESKEFFLRGTVALLLGCWTWIYTTFPLLKATMSIFDLPGLIAQNHQDICLTLCADGLECLLTHDRYRFLTLERTSYFKYMLGISLYFICVAIPFAGGIFGLWLTVESNVFRSQSDLSSSALMVEHWKNFIKLHIKDNGDLEVFAIGLQKVPTEWIKDDKWDGQRLRQKNPSWTWKRPSKWIPLKNWKAFQPQIVDYTCIRKRQISTSHT